MIQPSHKKKPLHLLPPILATLCIAVLAIAHVAVGNASDVSPTLHQDPNPQQEYAALLEAREEGNLRAEEEAIEAIRQEILSRLTPAERESAEQAPPEATVPPGAVMYIPASMPRSLLEECEEVIQRRSDPLCEVSLLHAEGKVRSGAFTRQEQEAVLESAE